MDASVPPILEERPQGPDFGERSLEQKPTEAELQEMTYEVAKVTL